jgi:membrane peptidoglycan carboxypeptidase
MLYFIKFLKKKHIFYFFLYLILSILISSISFFSFFFYYSPLDFFKKKYETESKKIYIFSNKNEILLNQFFDNKDNIYFNEIPSHVINAFISKEDSSFFKHRGISIHGIIRATIKNILSGKFLSGAGASTITQQTIKLFNGNLKKTVQRKLYDQIMALIIESRCSKEEIFQEYMRIIYFGCGIFGITNASKKFWNKKPYELTIEEGATLAGIIQRPEYYNPFKNYDLCIKQRNFVLKRMLIEKHISKIQYETLIKKPLILNPSNEYKDNQNILISIFDKIDLKKLKNFNTDIYIYTTIDKDIQKKTSQIFHKNINTILKRCNFIDGAITVIDIKNGEVLAIIQGYSPKTNGICRATNLWRQVGSTIKPLIYYYAYMNGDDENTYYEDTPLEESFYWHPLNFTKKFSGQKTTADALFESNNIVPIKILLKHGLKNFNELVNKTKCFKSENIYLSAALGCINSNTFNLSAYAASFSNNGKIYKPFFIKKIKNDFGGIIYKDQSEEILNLENEKIEKVKKTMLKIGEKLKIINNIKYSKPIYAKTGTSNETRISLFIGSNDKYAVAVYLGADDYTALNKFNISSDRDASRIGLEILSNI